MRFLHAAGLHLDSPLRGLDRYEDAPTEEVRWPNWAPRAGVEAPDELAAVEERSTHKRNRIPKGRSPASPGSPAPTPAPAGRSPRVAGRAQAYRERHQGPVLGRASKIFARITLGSFGGLAMDYHDDRHVLRERPDGSRLTVAGMSQCTRDQLFLALRIPAIEEHLREREAFPIAIDGTI